MLNVRMPDGKEVPYWNTFYQEVRYEKIDAHDLMRAMDIQYAVAQKLAETVNVALSEGKKPSVIELGSFSRYRKDVIDMLNPAQIPGTNGSEHKISIGLGVL